MQRIHTVFIIQKVFLEVTDKFLNEKLCPILLNMTDDPVPNIRFNVAKTAELIYKKINNSNKMRI